MKDRLNPGIVEVNVHNMTLAQARTAVDAALRRSKGVYRIRVIHGYRGGTVLREGIRKEYKDHPQVLRIEISPNPGQTELVLKEWY